MEINKFMKLTGNPDAYNAREVAKLELMTEDELSDYQYELEMDSGNLSDWDHIRAVITFKDKINLLQEELEEIRNK